MEVEVSVRSEMRRYNTARSTRFAGCRLDMLPLVLPVTSVVTLRGEEMSHELFWVHEIAHHFGIDDERLHELGWG
ncbi:hypothetical protein GCM10012275_53450 [Longimycelium tulufanense]|uniref:Uncharacterized protein n=1 Tax=Longimycelium tulufanense TaxID=907463 RepID=A0A8J3CD05_9PSEU|nr:hypothetical protein GCM10012275_53450 [Longimycelium tulufanense]